MLHTECLEHKGLHSKGQHAVQDVWAQNAECAEQGNTRQRARMMSA